MAKGITYKNIGGTHYASKGVIVKHGKTFVSDDENICKKFPNKFQRVFEEPVVTTDTTDDVVVKEKAAAQEGHVDVTSEFKAATDGITVTKDKKGYWIWDGESEPVNEVPYKKKEVEPAVIEYLGAAE